MIGKKLFIGGLNYETTEVCLQEELEKHGKVVSLRIVTTHDTGQSRGFAFATFYSEEDAEKASIALDNSVFDGRRIGVKSAIERR